jgi:hypothetical protein
MNRSDADIEERRPRRASFPARRVLSAFRRGSSSPVLVETSGGLFVTKLRGAAQGTPALIAEVIVAELAEVVGLPVPERVLIELEPSVRSDDKRDELADLLARSVGQNLGFRYLEGAIDLRPSDLPRIDDEFAARLLWLDALVMNPDRTDANPNLLLWKGQVWLVDHGAALSFQHNWSSVTEDSPRDPCPLLGSHLLRSRMALLGGADAALAALLSRDAVRRAVLAVPESFFAAAA